MNEKQLMEAVARLVKSQVEKEVAKQYNVMRSQIISEVAGMLNYSERKILSEIANSEGHQKNTSRPAESEFERSMRNLQSMPAFKNIVEKVEVPKRKESRVLSKNPLLNDILNETGGFTADEMYTERVPVEVGDEDYSVNDFDEVDAHVPWTNESKVASMQRSTPQAAAQQDIAPKVVLGTDHKPVDLKDSKVKSVMDILNNTNFREKYEAIRDAGNNFRDMGAPPPKFSSDYFEKTKVD